jgi:NodT family efflux transporter outer membrane factor (OMF) lipoprotein
MRRTLLLSSLFALTGCGGLPAGQTPNDPQQLAKGPDYVRWLPRNFQTAPPPAAASQPPALRAQPAQPDQLARPTQDWWTEFGSAELNGLIETALANNFDLRVAVARIEQAEKQARIADGARAPSVEFFGGIESRGPAYGVGTAASREDWYARRTYQAGLRVNYELDLWGRLGAETRSALELARASVFSREVVALTLVAETATAYFQHLSLSERIAIAENNLKNAQDVARAVERRLQRGDASLIEQQQQHIAIALIENNLANLQLQRERVLGKLAVYLGKPAGTIKIAGNSLRAVQPPQVTPGLPSELLCRRPDIRRAEAQLASASADVDAARANLLPSVALTGQFGQGSFNLSELLSPQSLLYSLAGNLTANVFDDERKENRVVQARARNRELLDQYANTVLAALRDVEDALAGIRLTQRQQQALTEALSRNSRLLALSQKVYQAGAMDYISLLDLQRNVYLAQDAEASARFEQVRSAIDLFKALGGGFAQQQPDPCAPTSSTGVAASVPAAPLTPATTAPAPSVKVPARPAGRLATSAAAQEAQAQAEQEAEAAARRASNTPR